MISFSTLKYAAFLSCLAALSIGYNTFLTLSTSLGKLSDNLVPLGRFLMYNLMKILSWKFVNLTIIGRDGRLQPFDCGRRDAILWTLSKLMFSSKEIKDITIDEHNVVKLSRYADDTTVLLSDVQSVWKLFDLSSLFERCSGLNLNQAKSEMLYGLALCATERIPYLISKWAASQFTRLGCILHMI